VLIVKFILKIVNPEGHGISIKEKLKPSTVKFNSNLPLPSTTPMWQTMPIQSTRIYGKQKGLAGEAPYGDD
jgi:hypothetical protein